MNKALYGMFATLSLFAPDESMTSRYESGTRVAPTAKEDAEPVTSRDVFEGIQAFLRGGTVYENEMPWGRCHVVRDGFVAGSNDTPNIAEADLNTLLLLAERGDVNDESLAMQTLARKLWQFQIHIIKVLPRLHRVCLWYSGRHQPASILYLAYNAQILAPRFIQLDTDQDIKSIKSVLNKRLATPVEEIDRLQTLQDIHASLQNPSVLALEQVVSVDRIHVYLIDSDKNNQESDKLHRLARSLMKYEILIGQSMPSITDNSTRTYLIWPEKIGHELRCVRMCAEWEISKLEAVGQKCSEIIETVSA
jgi:hypothetical protein